MHHLRIMRDRPAADVGGRRRAMIVGRFQPFHRGHLAVVNFALGMCDELTIVVGSSQESGTERNPFDAATRAAMIRAGLADSGVGTERIRISQAPDFGNDELWCRHITEKEGPFDLVVSGNAWVRDIFRGRGVEAVEPPMFERDAVSGTRIREMMARGSGGWEMLVTPGVAEIIRCEGRVAKAAAKGVPRRIPSG
jgi:nicotinamide-nucleotide adenylyltransferase